MKNVLIILGQLDSFQWVTLFLAGLLVVLLFSAKETVHKLIKMNKQKKQMNTLGIDPGEKESGRMLLVKRTSDAVLEARGKKRWNFDGEMIDAGMYVSFRDINDREIRGIFAGVIPDAADQDNPFYTVVNMEVENGIVNMNILMESTKTIKKSTFLTRNEFNGQV